MQVPGPDAFERDSRDWRGYWRAGLPSTDLALYVVGDDEGEEPDAASLALAATLLPELERLRDEAAAYLAGIVDRAKLALVGTVEVVSLTCDAHRRTAAVEVVWEGVEDAIWYVTFDLHPQLGRRPTGMGVKLWGAGAVASRAPPRGRARISVRPAGRRRAVRDFLRKRQGDVWVVR